MIFSSFFQNSRNYWFIWHNHLPKCELAKYNNYTPNCVHWRKVIKNLTFQCLLVAILKISSWRHHHSSNPATYFLPRDIPNQWKAVFMLCLCDVDIFVITPLSSTFYSFDLNLPQCIRVLYCYGPDVVFLYLYYVYDCSTDL